VTRQCLGAEDICCTSLVSHYFSKILCKNYNCIFVFVKVMPQKLAVVFFFNFNKFVFPNSQGSAATQLRCGGKYYLYFVENFMRFPAVKKL